MNKQNANSTLYNSEVSRQKKANPKTSSAKNLPANAKASKTVQTVL